MLFFGQNGYRVIAHDRRGHGKSDQPWNGNNMDQYADDLAELIEKLDLKNVIMIAIRPEAAKSSTTSAVTARAALQGRPGRRGCRR